MKIVILSESRADFGGVEPIYNEAKRRGHETRYHGQHGSWIDLKNMDWFIFLGDRAGVLREVLRVAEEFPGVGLAHLSGGDSQNGNLVDEPVRHSLSKFAHVHFPCTHLSADRLIRHGEDPNRIYTVGSTMVDDLVNFKPVKKNYKQYDLVQMHPAPNWQIDLREIITLPKFPKIFMMPNDDPGYGEKPKGISYLNPLSRPDFLQLLWNCNYFVGNSSAMYLEAQYLGVPCVQVGERNDGRESAFEIGTADHRTDMGLRVDWQKGAHGDGTAAEQILDILEFVGKPDKDYLRRRWT